MLVAPASSPGACSPYFQDRHVILLPDNDDAGRNHVRDVAAILEPVASSVRIVELPALPPKGDVIDWLRAGGTDEELRRLIESAPAVTAADHAEEEDEQPGDAEEEGEKKVKRSIATELVQIALAGTELFTTPGDHIAYAALEIDDHREVWPPGRADLRPGSVAGCTKRPTARRPRALRRSPMPW